MTTRGQPKRHTMPHRFVGFFENSRHLAPDDQIDWVPACDLRNSETFSMDSEPQLESRERSMTVPWITNNSTVVTVSPDFDHSVASRSPARVGFFCCQKAIFERAAFDALKTF